MLPSPHIEGGVRTLFSGVLRGEVTSEEVHCLHFLVLRCRFRRSGKCLRHNVYAGRVCYSTAQDSVLAITRCPVDDNFVTNLGWGLHPIPHGVDRISNEYDVRILRCGLSKPYRNFRVDLKTPKGDCVRSAVGIELVQPSDRFN